MRLIVLVILVCELLFLGLRGQAQMDSLHVPTAPLYRKFPKSYNPIPNNQTKAHRRLVRDSSNSINTAIHNQTNYFGRIYRQKRIISDSSRLGFHFEYGDKYVFALYYENAPHQYDHRLFKMAIEFDELPKETVVIKNDQLYHYNFTYGTDQSIKMGDKVVPDHQLALKIFPFNNQEYRILFYNEGDSYNIPEPLFDSTAKSFYFDNTEELIQLSSFSNVFFGRDRTYPSRKWLKDRFMDGVFRIEVALNDKHYVKLNIGHDSYSFSLFDGNQNINYSEKFKTYDASLAYEWEFDRNSEHLEYSIASFNSDFKTINKNMEPITTGKYKDLMEFGKWTYRHINGNLKAVGKYRQINGQVFKTGLWKYYNYQGQLIAKGKYNHSDGVEAMKGKWRFLQSDGKMVKVDESQYLKFMRSNIPILPDYFAVVRELQAN